MVMRIRVEDLGDEVRESIERGEPIEVERDGKVVARVEPRVKSSRGAIVELIEYLRTLPPIDEDFARDLEQIRREANRPIGPSPWE